MEYFQKHQGHQHVLIVPSDLDRRQQVGASIIYEIRSPLLSRTSRYRLLYRADKVETILQRERPHIIESGDPYQMAWKASGYARRESIAAIGFYHSHFPEAYVRSVMKYFGEIPTELMMDLSQRYVPKVYNQFHTTVVPSEPLAEVLRSWHVKRLAHVDLGVALDTFYPDAAAGKAKRQELTIHPDSLVLLYVGRLASEKNVSTLFEAFRTLQNESGQPFHLMVVGDGNQRAGLEKLCRETSAVTWKPYVDCPKELADIYRAADLFVHPGLQETFGLVTLESQAAGTPVIGIRGSYMDRLIFAGQAHWAAINSPASLAQAILRVADHDLRAMGREAAEAVCTHFSWDKTFCKMLEIYQHAWERRTCNQQLDF